MKRVFKYKLDITDRQVLTLAAGSNILAVKNQYDDIVVYVEVDVEQTSQEKHNIVIVGTGHCLPDLNLKYLGTVLTHNASLVWHIYKEV